MQIKIIEENELGPGVIQNKLCRESISCSSCIHGDKLILTHKTKIKNKFYEMGFEVKYCPFCGEEKKEKE